MAEQQGKKKKGKAKGKTVSLNEFLSGDGNTPPMPVRTKSWADETNDLEEEDISTAWTDTQKSKVNMKSLPSAPRAATAPNIDASRLPKNPPFTVFIGNLSYEASEEDVVKHFDKHALKATNVRLMREKNDGRLKGFGYAEFESLPKLIEALAVKGTVLRGRQLQVDIAEGRNDGMNEDQYGRGTRGGRFDDDRTSGDWRGSRNSSPPPTRQYGQRNRSPSHGYHDNRGPGGYDRPRYRDNREERHYKSDGSWGRRSPPFNRRSSPPSTYNRRDRLPSPRRIDSHHSGDHRSPSPRNERSSLDNQPDQPVIESSSQTKETYSNDKIVEDTDGRPDDPPPSASTQTSEGRQYDDQHDRRREESSQQYYDRRPPHQDDRGGDRRYEDRGGDRRYNDRRYDDRGGDRRYSDRRYDDRGGDRRYNDRGYDDRGGDRRYDNRGGDKRYNDRGYDDRGGDRRGGDRRYDDRGGDRRYDDRGGGRRYNDMPPPDRGYGGRGPYRSGGRSEFDDQKERGGFRDHGDRGPPTRDPQDEMQPKERKKLQLQPRTKPVTEASTTASSIFGGAKPVDTAKKEREIEEKLKKKETEVLPSKEGKSGSRKDSESGDTPTGHKESRRLPSDSDDQKGREKKDSSNRGRKGSNRDEDNEDGGRRGRGKKGDYFKGSDDRQNAWSGKGRGRGWGKRNTPQDNKPPIILKKHEEQKPVDFEQKNRFAGLEQEDDEQCP